MAKEISALIKLQIRGGAANPSSSWPCFGAKGVNIMDFVNNLMVGLKKTRKITSSSYNSFLLINLSILLLKRLRLRFSCLKLLN